MDTPDYVAANREAWASYAPDYAVAGRGLWSEHEPTWGIWSVPECEVGLLPDVEGRDTLELGCGTAYVSAWLARRGARAVGLDPTRPQLQNALRFQREFALSFPLVCGIAEALPFPDAAFDLVVSEYGAAIWSDPYRWVPEAARVLRPEGQLVFLGNSTLLMLCADDDEHVPASERLQRAQRGMHRFAWPDTAAIEFHLSHGDWLRLLRANGFEVLSLVELYPPPGAETTFEFVDLDWARRWPSEEAWVARKKS